MNPFEKTNLPFLREDLNARFGEAGDRLFRLATERCEALAAGADDGGVPAIREHLRAKLFPAMACYQALLQSGIPREEALAFTGEETRRAALAKRAQTARMARLPGAYHLYRLGVRAYMGKFFPPEGWETEWVRCDGREIHFNLRRCLYWDQCNAQGCPELCVLYCENDTIAFSGLLPKIRFERSGTLGSGAECCDFHFLRAGKDHGTPPSGR